jgi:hypothetical protein
MSKVVWQKAAHNQEGSSDKLYLMVVVERDNGNHDAIAYWGRRKSAPADSKVYGSNTSKGGACAIALAQFDSKLKRGYVDIDDSRYSGSVTWRWMKDTSWMSGFLNVAEAKKPDPKPEPKKPAAKPVRDTKNFVVKCVDALGAEEHFGQGFEYVAETHDDPEMLWVTDRTGRRDAWFAERFERVAEGMKRLPAA